MARTGTSDPTEPSSSSPPTKKSKKNPPKKGKQAAPKRAGKPTSTQVRAPTTSSIKLKPLYATRPIKYESDVLRQELRTIKEAEWGLDYLQEHLKPLLSPPPIAYPRLVKQFYQNLRKPDPNQDNSDTRITTIDGVDITLSPITIATALGFEPHRPANSPLGAPREYTPQEIIQDLGGGKSGRGNCIMRVDLPQDMLLIDNVFTRNLFPVGHPQARTQAIKKALMAVWKHEWFSVGKSIFDVMCRITSDIEAQNRSGKTMALHYPRFITRILEAQHIKPKSNESIFEDFPSLGKGTLNLSASHMGTKKRKGKAQGEENQAVPTPIQPQPSSLSDKWTLSQADYDRLTKGLNEMKKGQLELHDRLFEIEHMLRFLVETQYPDEARHLFDRVKSARREDVENVEGEDEENDEESGEDDDGSDDDVE